MSLSQPFHRKSKVKVWKSAVQSINTATETLVTLDQEQYDVNSEFASNRFTAKRAGYYLVIGIVVFHSAEWVATKSYYALVKKDGVIMNMDYVQSDDAGAYCIWLKAVGIAHFAVGEYVELYARQDTGVAKNVYGAAAPDGRWHTSLTVVRLA